MLKQPNPQENDEALKKLVQVEFETPSKIAQTSNNPEEVSVDSFEEDFEESSDKNEDPETPQQSKPIAIRKGKRVIKQPSWMTDMVAYALPIIEDNIPCTFKEAVQNPKSVKWKEAIDEEIGSFTRTRLRSWCNFQKARKQLGVSGFTPRKKASQVETTSDSKLDW